MTNDVGSQDKTEMVQNHGDEDKLPEEGAPLSDEIAPEATAEGSAIRCPCCCRIRCLPYGLFRWMVATVASIVALAISATATGMCYFLKVTVLKWGSAEVPAELEIGLNYYEDTTTGSCEIWHEGVDKDIVYDDVYWKVVRYLVDIALVLMALCTLFLLSTGVFEYKCAGRTVFAKLAVTMVAINTLHMLSFMVFASDICMDDWHMCAMGDGAFFMMAGIAAWWIVGWLVLHIVPFGEVQQPVDDSQLTTMPARWRSLFLEVCAMSIVAAAAANGAVIAIERRD